MEGGLRLSIRSLALVVIPSDWRATSRGCHTRHRADLCNFVCLCSCLEKRNYSPLIEDEVPAFVSLKKLQFKNKPSCRDHCITARHRLLLRTGTRGGGWRQGTAGLGLKKGPTLGTSQARGNGRKSLSRGCGDRARSCGRENEGAAHGRRNSLLPAPALQQRWRSPRPPPSPPRPATALFPLLPSGWGLSLSSDGVRVVRFSCVTYSGSGDFTFP